jgi:hypothetical protein
MDFRNLGNRILIPLCAVIFLGAMALTVRAAGRPAAKPLTKADVIDLLKGDVPPQRVGDLARERGIDFQVTSEVEGELRRAGATDDLLETFRSLTPKPHGVQISVTPGDAEVYVDDERQGKTSPEGRLRITTLAPGQHRIRIALDGYRDYESTIQIKSGEMASVAAQMQRSGSGTSSNNEPVSPTKDSGHALLAKVVQGLGGKTKVASVKSFRTHGTLSLHLPQGDLSGELEAIGDFSGLVWQRYTTSMGVFTTAASPSDAFMVLSSGVQDLTSEQKEEMLKGLWRNAYFVGQHLNDPSFSFTPGGDAMVGGIATKILEVQGAGAEGRWFIDPTTGWVMRATWTEISNGMLVQVVEDYQDWQLTSGIYVPFRETRTQNGKRFSEGVLTKVEVNPRIDPRLFVR